MAQIPLHPKTTAFTMNRLFSFNRCNKKFNPMKVRQLVYLNQIHTLLFDRSFRSRQAL